MIDWLTILIALVIIAALVGGFGFLAWKMNMSDPLVGDENYHPIDSTNDKKRKEKNASEQSKKKRKDQKKPKRENKDEEEKQSKRTKPLQTSEETDDEREESEQELLNQPTQTVETSSKARKRNKNKAPTSTTSSESSTKNPPVARAPPATHPKSASKDELEPAKQQTKVQTSNKPATTAKKPTETVQKQQPQEQPFIVVGGNRQKTATPPVQQNKPQVNATTSVQRPPSLPQRETPAPVLVATASPVPVKQAPTVPPKISDLIKALPSSQAVVSELMAVLDAFALSADELDIIMHKIANKQSVVKQDWNKLQQGQKVDPHAHIGQVLDDSAKAYEDNVKTNSLKHIQDLTNELHAEKRRNNELLKEKNDKEREIQILHAQLDSVQYKNQPTNPAPPSQKLQILELELKRLTDENALLTRQLAQQQLTASNSSNTNDASNMKVQVLSEQIKKLSVDNANWEKKATSNELLVKEVQKEKEDLIRYKEQLTQSLQNAKKDVEHLEQKQHQQVNETRTSHLNEINEYKVRIERLEKENEQLKREEIVHVEPSTATDIQTLTVNNEEREQFENEIERLQQVVQSVEQKEREANELKEKLKEEIVQYQSQENEFKREMERLQQDKNQQQQQADESRNNELNTLRMELKTQSQELLRQEHEKQQRLLADLLPQYLRNQLPTDNQDFDQWLSSYHQLFESNQRNSQEESEALRRENAQIYKNMTDIENQLKEIEKTVQSKEETLLTELNSKDAMVENVRGENDQLTHEVQHLRQELQTLRASHNASASEARALKLQLDERFLAANNPSIVAADESFELLKQPSPSLSPIVVDIRAEQLNEMIRSSKEALENQHSVTQQLAQHLNDIHQSGGHGETSTESSSSNQQS